MTRDELVIKNLRLADTIGYRMWKKSKIMTLDDWKQTARLYLCEAADKFDPDKGNFSTFAYRLIWNKLCNENRDYFRHNVVAEPIEFINEIEDESNCHSIDEYLTILNDTEAQIIRLRVMDGMTLKEIGEAIGMTKQGVDWHYKRAVKKLKMIL